MDAGDVIAALALVVALGLAILRFVEFIQATRRVDFSISYSTLVSGDPTNTDRPSFVAIRVGNRWTLPIRVNTIGFLLTDGRGLLFNQIAELATLQPPLPAVLAPTDGYTMGIRPDRLLEAVRDKGRSKAIKWVTCGDASGRGYRRRVKKHEREQIEKAFEALQT